MQVVFVIELIIVAGRGALCPVLPRAVAASQMRFRRARLRGTSLPPHPLAIQVSGMNETATDATTTPPTSTIINLIKE